MNNYPVVHVPIDSDMAKTLYYSGVAVTLSLRAEGLDVGPFLIHYDSDTNMKFSVLWAGYAGEHGVHPKSVYFSIDAKGELV